ncbi:hypothetical protein GW17_00042601 [Ensete ventricosum]|nr:hypothetical protein GW17_00042601 [Ensete ventricosum]
MSQERSSNTLNLEHPGGSTHITSPTLQTRGPSSTLPTKEVNGSAPTPNRYWRLFNDPGFSPPKVNPRQPVVMTKAFLGLAYQCSPTEVTLENPSTPVVCSTNHSRDIAHMAPKLDTLSSDSTDSIRKQLRQVNQRLDEVQKEFIKSKEELGETSKGRSPFVSEIHDKPIPTNFRLPSLESCDSSSDPSEHVTAFRA